MSAPILNQLFVPGTSEEVRDDILTDIRLASLQQGAEIPTSVGSEEWIWADAQSHVAMLQYANIATIRPSLNPLDCPEEDVDAWMDALRLPRVGATPSSGAIRVGVTGTGTLVDGQRILLANGKRAHVVGTWSALTDGQEVDAITDDAGADTEVDPDAIVRFVAPPFNVLSVARISLTRPLRGGTNAETLARKRERVLNRLGGQMGGGNWRQIRETIFRSRVSVQYVFVYPAIGGPSSVKAVVMREYDRRDNRNDYSRAVDSATLTMIRGIVHAAFPDEVEKVIDTSADEAVDVAIKVTIPDSALSGGNGQGWLDQAPWPLLAGGDTKVTVTTVTSSNVIIVSATTATAPVDGVTRIAWWSKTDMRFRIATVVGHSGATTAWTLTLDQPLASNDGTIVAVGDYICPAAANMIGYGETWVAMLNELGAGENTALAGRVPRALRRPYISDEPKVSLTIVQLNRMQAEHPEITDAAWSFRSLTDPSTPAGVDDKPNVLVVRRFGVYKL